MSFHFYTVLVETFISSKVIFPQITNFLKLFLVLESKQNWSKPSQINIVSVVSLV